MRSLSEFRKFDAVSRFPNHVLTFVENHVAPCAAIPLQTTDESSGIDFRHISDDNQNENRTSLDMTLCPDGPPLGSNPP